MKFSHIDGTYRVIKITGPAHNLLGLEFTEVVDSSEPDVIDLRNCEKCNFDHDKIKLYVGRGVADANKDFGTSYTVKIIQIVGDDSPAEDRYQELAYSIVERLFKGEAFS